MSSGQSQMSQQRKQIDQQVALLERALSLEKKGGNNDIDLTKLLKDHDLAKFEQESSSESADSQNNDSINSRKRKHK